MTESLGLSSTLTRLTLALAAVVCLCASPVHADQSGSLPVLSDEQELALARAFAPTLVFHASEEYFPTSSMTPLPIDAPIEDWPSRVDQYRRLSAQAKLQRAALAYRVFSRVHDRHVEVVVEYWCYYVYNEFTVLGGWLPYRLANNHPHDLERLYLVLRPSEDAWSGSDAADEAWARESFQVQRIVANAHDGSIPPNQYEPQAGEAVALPLTLLVERGSHAMAPDLDNDGRFTPGIDSTDVLKLQWGIRDRGATWGWYRASYMDGRGATAVRLCGPAAGDPLCTRYTLYPADGLQRWFQELQLSDDDRHKVVGKTPWLVRTFGDIRVEELMVPPDPANGRMLDKMLRRRVRSESGFVVGFTTVDHAAAFVGGRRDLWEVRSRRVPDVLTEAAVLFPSGRATLGEATVWGSYNLDAITNLMLGFGWFSESQSTSVTAGVELRIGRFRVRPAWRLRDAGFDSRVITTF